MTVKARIWTAILMIVFVILLGATGFHFVEGWPWFDGLYMTLITMTTVGYGETHPLSPAGKVFNMFLIVMAVMSGGFLITASTQALLQFELRHFLGRRRMERELAHLENHFIICGAGRVGRTVAREFHEHKVPFVLIDKDPERAQWAIEQQMPVVIGNAHSEAELDRAQIQKAKALVAVVTSDAENLYVVLTARSMNPTLKIIARASEEEAAPKMRRAGANEVVSPYQFLGRRISRVLLQPHLIDFIETGFGPQRLDVQLEEFRVPEGSPMVGKTLAESAIGQSTHVLVLAQRRPDGTLSFNPAPSVVIQANDSLIAVGDADHLKHLAKLTGEPESFRG